MPGWAPWDLPKSKSDMRIIALKTIHKAKPGDTLDVTTDQAKILVAIGAAKYESDPEPTTKRRYRRKDLQAEA